MLRSSPRTAGSTGAIGVAAGAGSTGAIGVAGGAGNEGRSRSAGAAGTAATFGAFVPAEDAGVTVMSVPFRWATTS